MSALPLCVVLVSHCQDESRQQQLTELLGVLSTGRVLRDQISVFVALAFIYRFVKRNACPPAPPSLHARTHMHTHAPNALHRAARRGGERRLLSASDAVRTELEGFARTAYHSGAVRTTPWPGARSLLGRRDGEGGR